MSVAQQERARYEQYQSLLPTIVESLARGEDCRSVAAELTSREGVDHVQSYRWVHDTEEQIERFRKRRAVLAVIPVWLMGAVFVVSALMLLADVGPGRTGLTVLLAAASFFLSMLAAVVAWRLSRNPWRAWLSRQQHLLRAQLRGRAGNHE